MVADEHDPDTLVRTLKPSDLPSNWKLPAHTGHVVDYQVSEWNQYLIQGESDRAADYGITFTVVDAGLDPQASLAGIEELMAGGVNVLNFTAVDPGSAADQIADVVAEGIPVICATSAVDGCSTVVSADDYGAAFAVGVWAGNDVKERLGGSAVVLDVGYAALESTVQRSKGFLDGITSILGEEQVTAVSVDGNGLKDVSVTVATEILLEQPDVNVIFGINDDSAIGALQAYEAVGFNLESLLVVGFGCDGTACKDLLQEDGPYKVSAATFPEYQGRLLIDAGVAAFNDVTLPDTLVAPSVPMTALNLKQYYSVDDDTYVPNFDAISAIPIELIRRH
ncbi:MAG: sugar ABC transporter substrate-binding protein [Thermomicrobiales bacterium]|nr:sugar ABC transporter substrate-binding protein [Thermomicrobiales bacterium]